MTLALPASLTSDERTQIVLAEALGEEEDESMILSHAEQLMAIKQAHILQSKARAARESFHSHAAILVGQLRLAVYFCRQHAILLGGRASKHADTALELERGADEMNEQKTSKESVAANQLSSPALFRIISIDAVA